MSPNAPLTDEQRNAVTELRAMYNNLIASLPLGTAKSVDERAQNPDPENLPADVTIHVEVAPPSPRPHPLLDNTGVLKAPERVPVYFYAIRNERVEFEAKSASELANTRVIFIIHGGGNLIGHPAESLYIEFYTDILRAVAFHSTDAGTTDCVVIAPSYRLATIPENAFPAALQDLVAAYDYILGKGYKGSNVIIAGESAGGNHALVLTHLILQSNRSPPRGVIPIAPCAIQVYDRLSEHAKALDGRDVLDLSIYDLMSCVYMGDSGVSRTDPLVSSAFIDFAPSWPRTLILVSTLDHLIDAAREVAQRLAALGRPVELVEYKERPHAWWIMPQIFPENVQDAVERISRFVLQ